MNPGWFILSVIIGGCLGLNISSKERYHSFEDEAFTDLSELEESLAGCAQSCLSDLYTKAGELQRYQDPREKFDRLCLLYTNASSCIADEELCPDGDLLKFALGGIDELCNKRREELEPHIPCLEKNTEKFVKSCDNSCGLKDSIDVLMDSAYFKNVTGLGDIKCAQKEIDQVCNTAACVGSCLASELNTECGKPSGSIIVGALLRPFISVSGIFEELGWHTKFDAFIEVPPMCRDFLERKKLEEIISGNRPSKWRKVENHSKLDGMKRKWNRKEVEKEARTGRSTSHSHESYEEVRFLKQKENSGKLHSARRDSYSHENHNRNSRRVEPVKFSRNSISQEERINNPKPFDNFAPSRTRPMSNKNWNANSRESAENLHRVRPRQINRAGTSSNELQSRVLVSSRPNQDSRESRGKPMDNRQSVAVQVSSSMVTPNAAPQTTPLSTPTAQPARPTAQPEPPVTPVQQPTRFVAQQRPLPRPVQPTPASRLSESSHESEESSESLHQIYPRQAGQPSPPAILILPAQPRPAGPPRSRENSRRSSEENNLSRPNQPAPPTQQPTAHSFKPQQPQAPRPNSGSHESRERQDNQGFRPTQQLQWRPTSSPPTHAPPRPSSSWSQRPSTNPPNPPTPPRPSTFFPNPPSKPTSSPPPPPSPPRPTAPPTGPPKPQRPTTSPPKPPTPPRPTSPHPPPPPPQPQPRPPQRPGGRYRWRRVRSVDVDERYRWHRNGGRQTRQNDDDDEARYRWRRFRKTPVMPQ